MKKITFIFALLCASMMGFAIDWSGYEYLGDGAGGGAYTNKYKVAPAEGQNVVNIQQPGWASEPGIYTSDFGGAISSCSLGDKCAIDGGGIVLYLSAFTAKETEVTVVAALGTKTFTVYYEDGTEGGGEPDPDPEPEPEPAGINWDNYSWLGDGAGGGAYTNKYKVAPAEGQNVVNIQQPGWASEPGIYTSDFGGAISSCSLGDKCAIDGGGIVLYLSAFTAKETEVTVVAALGTKTFTVYYADGTEGGSTPEPTEIYDVNFALQSEGGAASAKSGNDAGLANNGNTGDRWWSETADMTDEQKNDQWWQVNLGQRRIFNTIQIVWEGAWGKSFDIQISDDGSAWTTVKEIRNQNLAGETFPYTQNIELDAKKTAQYVRFQGIERGTQWAYSFWEFRVLLPGVSVLTSIDLSAAATIAQTGGVGVVLTAQPKDQNGQAMAESVSYEITPAAAGHMSGNTFIPDQVGNASIRAYNGSVYSSAVQILGVPSANLALSTNISTDNKIIAQSEFAPNGTDAFHAVDGNMGSIWQGSPTAGNVDDSQEYDSWFVVDLGAYYNIALVALHFEGACSELYHIDFSANNVDWNLGYNLVGTGGINARNDYWTDLDNNTKVRYVRFWSTKAATGWGMKMYEFEVYGTEWVDTGDTEAPEMTSADLISCSFHKAVIDVAATDNHEVARFHVVDAANGIDANFAADVNGQAHINLDVNESTEYHLTITAVDAANNVSDGMLVEFTSPAMGADLALNKPVEASGEDPAQPASNAVIENDALWWSAFAGETGDERVYDAWLSVDLGGYFDINKVAVRWEGACSKHYRVEFSANKTDWRVAYLGGHDAVATHWEEFTDTEEDATKVRYVRVFSTEAVSQYGIKIMALRVYGVAWIPEDDAQKPVMVDAELVSNTHNSAVISVSATDDYEVVKFHVVDAANSINAEFVPTDGKITVTGLIPNTEHHLTITAIDAASKESENNIVVDVTTPVYNTVPQVACAAPEWPADQVQAIYSPTYSADCGFGEWESGTTITDDTYGKKYTVGNGYFGMVDFNLNCINMEALHYDIWVADNISLSIVPIWGGAEQSKTVNLVGQQWNSIDIDKTEYPGIENWSNIYQMKLANIPNGTVLWIANAYFYRTTEMEDEEAPYNASASVAEESFYSVKITAQAEDNSGAVNFKVMIGEEILATGAAVTNVATTITVNNLASGTNYNFKVIAYDVKGNEAAPVQVAATTKFMPAPAPAPVFGNNIIVPVFTDAMEGAPATIHSGGWGESTNAQWIDIAPGDKVFYAQNFNYAGWHSWGDDIDATGMQFLHVDVYSLGMTSVSITPISHDPTHEGSAAIALTPNDWTSIDIALSAYEANNIEWNKIFQFKLMDPVGGTEFMIDNVYFWRYAAKTNVDGWSTYACAETVVVPDGITAYWAEYQKNGTEEILLLHELSDGIIPAGAGVLLKSENASTTYGFTITAETPATDMSDNVLVGCAVRTDISEVAETNDIFCLRRSELFEQTAFFLYSGQYVPAGKAYLPLPKDPSGPNPAQRRVRFVFSNEQVATGVGNVQNDAVQSTKELINGQLFIRRGDSVYTVQGVRVQ